MARSTYVLLAALLTGCADFGAVRDRARSAGQEISTEATDTAMVWLCFGITRGEILRRFATPELAAAHNTLCGQSMPAVQPGEAAQ